MYFLRFSDPENYVSNILISVLPTCQLSRQERLIISKAIKEYKLCLNYTDFSTTYLSAQLPRKTYHFKGNQRIQRYTENTLHRRKIEMVNARLLVQQFTHPVHPNSSYRLSYLLRQFVDNTGKNMQYAADKIQGKNKQDSTRANISLFRKVMVSQ